MLIIRLFYTIPLIPKGARSLAVIGKILFRLPPSSSVFVFWFEFEFEAPRHLLTHKMHVASDQQLDEWDMYL